MILFIVLLVLIIVFLVFVSDGLLDKVKQTKSYNARIKYLINKKGSYYNKNDLHTHTNAICEFLYLLFAMGFFDLCVVFGISLVVQCFYPSTPYQYDFPINPIKIEISNGQISYYELLEHEESAYFLVFRDTEEGEKGVELPTNKTYILNANNERPKVEVHQKVQKFPKWLSMWLWVELFEGTTTECYKIYVPQEETV